MGEPIYLYDRDGNKLTLYGAAYCRELVDTGEWFYEPQAEPVTVAAVVVKDDTPPPVTRKARKGKEL
jgi:hypothetical protein